MPNGGPDCCGNCSFNSAVQQIAHPQPWADVSEFSRMSMCTLRGVQILNPFWTYCDNFEYGKNPELRMSEASPIGPITSSGLYEGYVRIPWLGNTAPEIHEAPSDLRVRFTCQVCRFRSNGGIRLSHQGSVLEFCTNLHYLTWWNSVSEVSWGSGMVDLLEGPETRYKTDGTRRSISGETNSRSSVRNREVVIIAIFVAAALAIWQLIASK